MSVGQFASTVGELYSATLLSSTAAIRPLANTAKPLLSHQHRSCQPEFFLASISKKWIPHAVAVTCDQEVVGIVYAKERLFLGHPTGIIYTDTTTGTNLVAKAAHRGDVLTIALRSILGQARALRLVLPRDEIDLQSVSDIADSMEMDVASFRHDNHSHLTLPPSYDEFLNSVGARTRRNFRYYRRRFERSGGRFIERVPFDSFCGAAWHLKGKSATQADGSRIQRSLNMLAAVDEPILIGLQGPQGEWWSIAGGWCDLRRATLLFQMNNDREHAHDSLSQVLRSYLIEELIARRVHDLFFWAGCSAPLARYAQHIPATAWHLDSRSAGWRTLRILISSMSSLLPKRFGELAQWVVPSAESNDR